MKTIINEESEKIIKGTASVTSILINYIVIPASYGLYGFAAFFSILITTKFFVVLFDDAAFFTTNIGDILLSIVGFIIAYVFKLIENSKKTS